MLSITVTDNSSNVEQESIYVHIDHIEKTVNLKLPGFFQGLWGMWISRLTPGSRNQGEKSGIRCRRIFRCFYRTVLLWISWMASLVETMILDRNLSRFYL